MKNPNILTVADFFCGAGGWSEGFRLAGLEVVFALDNWATARKTHYLNHPNCSHPGLDCFKETGGDILNIEINEIDNILPDVDIIVGSPPCISFSQSNKAGNGDKSLGIKLIEKFLQIVAIKKHKKSSILKYWLMENVPNSRLHIKNEYSFEDLNINEEVLKFYGINKLTKDIALVFSLDKKNIFNSANFGVPQRRERFITGDFPIPKETHSEENWITLSKIINNLSKKSDDFFIDPNFNTLKIPNSELTDHFYSTRIHKFEWEHAKLVKQQGRFYGKMSFPENLFKPSRTIMATRSARSREALILSSSKEGKYRLPTIREIACIMSFPISYQFDAGEELSKYRLVGNAVCPKLSFNFAKKILNVQKMKLKKMKFSKKSHLLKVNLRENPPIIKIPNGRLQKANFAFIVPDLKFNNVRIELDNNFPNRGNKLSWRASIHHATGKKSMKEAFPTQNDLNLILGKYHNQEEVKQFRNKVRSIFNKKIPSSKKFQEQFCQLNPNPQYFTPFNVLRTISKLIIEDFLTLEFNKETIINLDKKNSPIIKLNRSEFPQNKISLIHLLALDSLIYICDCIKKQN